MHMRTEDTVAPGSLLYKLHRDWQAFTFTFRKASIEKMLLWKVNRYSLCMSDIFHVMQPVKNLALGHGAS